MSFESEKEVSLKRMTSYDKSDKGSVDKKIKSLLDKINSLDNYYTTSSCAGRIIIIKIPSSGKKKEAEFLYRTHDKASVKKVVSKINKLAGDKDSSVWFRQEPAILHVAARTLEDAYKFLVIARKIGFKRGGLFEFKKRFILEMVSTENIDAIIAKQKGLLVSEDYLKVLIEDGNKKLEKTWKKIVKLEKSV